jgi:hypothetical protein
VNAILHPGSLMHPDNLILFVLGVGLLVLKLYALVDCTSRPAAGFLAHSKQTKQIWLIILAVALLATLISGPLGILGLLGTVAAIVYLVDVKPAITGTGTSW